MSFILISGLPNSGKTTLVQKLIKELQQSSSVTKFYGFYTEDVRNLKNERIGFDIVLLDGNRRSLARASTEISNTNQPAGGMNCKVGKYVLYLQEFEELCTNFMESTFENSLLVIDEIGKMELMSKKFLNFVKYLLTVQNIKVIATVPSKTQLTFIEKLKNHPHSQLFHISKSNRNEMYEKVLRASKKLVD